MYIFDLKNNLLKYWVVVCFLFSSRWFIEFKFIENNMVMFCYY